MQPTRSTSPGRRLSGVLVATLVLVAVATTACSQAAAPPAPTGVVAFPGNGRASVSWQEPTQGATVSSYVVSTTPSAGRCTSTRTSCTVRGLTNGRVYTIKASDIPRGRGDGQAIRLLIDLANEDGVLRLFLPDMLGKYIAVSTSGRGFVVPGVELISERRAGKTILVLKPGEEWFTCVPAKGDHVAVIGQNRKLLVFPLNEIPEMPRGTGVQLQKYKDGGISDVKVFALADGLTWRLGDKTRTEPKLTDWLGVRAQVGRMPPNGFPKSGKFGDEPG